METFLREQMRTPYFPIDFNTFQAEISFVKHAPGDTLEVCDSTITVYKQNHPGDSYGYRVDQEKNLSSTPQIQSIPTLLTEKSTITWILLRAPIF